MDELTLLIGDNSTGKTAALAALAKIFSPNQRERLITRDDFHIDRSQNPEQIDELELSIEAVFLATEVRDGDEPKDAIPVFFEGFTIAGEGDIPKLRVRLEASWKRSTNPEGSIESNIYFITQPEGLDISEGSRLRARREKLDAIQMLYVPAMRDPSKELRNASGGMLHDILSTVKWSEDGMDKIAGKIEELNEAFISEDGVGSLGTSIGDSWKTYDNDPRYKDARLSLNGNNFETALKNVQVSFRPTVSEREYAVDDFGDGLRSLFYFSLVGSLLEIEEEIRKTEQDDRNFTLEPPVLTILAVEEPENNIAPHLLGQLVSHFEKMTTATSCQVIITSHSPSIVSRISPEHIRYFRIDPTHLSTVCAQLTLPEKKDESYKYVRNSLQAYPELLFAKLVVLGEGESEEIVLPRYIGALCGEKIDALGISVVPLGGRHVKYFWKLLSDLDIPYVTLLDLDRERFGGGWGRIAYAIEQKVILDDDKLCEFLDPRGDALTKDGLDAMKGRELSDTTDMEYWIDQLKKHNIFFSAPLDIDLLMLEAYSSTYKSIVEGEDGPRVSGMGKIVDIESHGLENQDYRERVKKNVRDVLHSDGGNGSTYTANERCLMVWYKYFFIDVGKPSTHILALSNIGDDALTSSSPAVLSSLCEQIKVLVSTSEHEA